jgi:hypothetical protein
MFLRLGEMFFYIVTFPRRLVVHMDWLNNEGSDLKLYLIRF